MYRKSIYLPVCLQWSFFSWKIGLHLRMSCVNLHTLHRIFHPTFCIWTKDCTRCLLTVLHIPEEKTERKGEEEGAAGKEVLILLEVKVISWTMTCAWRHHTHRTKEWTSQLVLHTAPCYSMCVHVLGQRSCSFYEATDLFWEHDTQLLWWICRSQNLKVYSHPQARVLWWDMINEALSNGGDVLCIQLVRALESMSWHCTQHSCQILLFLCCTLIEIGGKKN